MTAEEKPRRLTALETAARHERLITMKAAGYSWQAICAELGMSNGGARKAYYDWRDRDKLDMATISAKSPIDFIHEHIIGFRMIRLQLHEIADRAMNESARVGALLGAAKMREREISLLQAAGMLPKNLGKFAVEIDLRFVQTKLVELIRELPINAQAKSVFAENIVDALNPGQKLAEKSLELAQKKTSADAE